MTRPRSPRPRLRGGTRRRGVVLLELVTAAAICFAGYAFGAEWMQVQEARWVVSTLRLFGLHEVSGALPGHILVFGADGTVYESPEPVWDEGRVARAR